MAKTTATPDLRGSLKRQYHAGLKMLRQAIDACPDPLWTGADTHPNTFWHVAYHVLFFTDLYAQTDVEAFTPWEHHREEYESLGSLPWPPHDPPAIGEPYTKAQVLQYLDLLDGQIDANIDALDLAAPESGFPWYPVTKLEHQLINLRHLQHHAAQLADRLRRVAHVGVDWVGSATSAH